MKPSDTLDDIVQKIKKKAGVVHFELYHRDGGLIFDAKSLPEKKIHEIFTIEDGNQFEIFMKENSQDIFTRKNSFKLLNACNEVLYFDVDYDVQGTGLVNKYVFFTLF